MPAGRIDQTLYVGPFANVEAMNATSLYKPGELGSQIQQPNGKSYQLIQLDSGATAAVSTGAPVAGSLAYWKSRANYIVTNNPLQAENWTSGSVTAVCNSVAGVFCSLSGGAAGTATITPGNYGVVQQRGTHVGVRTDGTASTAGQWLQVDTAGVTDKVDAVALSTAPAFTPVGISTAATSAVTTGYTPARLGGWDLVDTP